MVTSAKACIKQFVSNALTLERSVHACKSLLRNSPFLPSSQNARETVHVASHSKEAQQRRTDPYSFSTHLVFKTGSVLDKSAKQWGDAITRISFRRSRSCRRRKVAPTNLEMLDAERFNLHPRKARASHQSLMLGCAVCIPARDAIDEVKVSDLPPVAGIHLGKVNCHAAVHS